MSMHFFIASTLTFAAENKEPPMPGSPLQCNVRPVADLLDINNATKNQLKVLPGIDEVCCKKIIAGRPYVKPG
jgi:hypothetical protein